MDVQTDHQIVGFGTNRMQLFNSPDGAVLVTAERPDETSPWTVHADGVPDVSATDRPTAITALCDQALAALPGTGYSTLCPHGLAELP
ncbi:hypothetical protein [Mycobacterium sp. NPDC050853]|uniref:hypothetical protein n=1 Tax=Mycobacterium sp. NPDC050853 TaxID=3155160 RepID=UPI0033F9C349